MKKQFLYITSFAIAIVAGTISTASAAVFATPSLMHTISRNYAGRALVAKSPEEFKKYMLKAAAAEKKVVPLAIAGATGMGITTAALVKNDEQCVRFYAPYSAFSVAAYLANIPGAIEQKNKYRLYAQHADLLYALLQDDAFKKSLGVTSWAKVRRVRKAAEAVGISTQTVGSFLALLLNPHLYEDQGNNPKRIILCLGTSSLLTPLIGIGAKPLITNLLRKKGGAPTLEAEFDKAIAAAQQKEMNYTAVAA